MLNVACWIKGTSPIPLYHETPLADLIAFEALGTERQNSINLLKFKVALVIIAIGLVLSKLESIKQETNLNVSDSLQWLIEEDESEIEAQINKKYGIGNFTTNKGVA